MSINTVHGFWFVYWIVRDTATKPTPRMAVGWLRELGGYWRVGKGIQIKTGKYITQVGVCKKREFTNEDEGTLNVLEGRMMTTPTSEIGDWR